MTEKVLIIDDDTDTLRLVRLMLQHEGYEISTASSGSAGITKATEEHPDVILLDVMMPGMDGFEVTRRLRADPRTQTTPICMFTAKSLLNDRVEAFEVGVDDYLTKPTSPADLQSHVRQLLERARGKRAVASTPSTSDASARSQRIGLVSARSGMGVSFLAMNLAAALQMRSQAEVILAEFTPGQGTLGMDLGLPSARGLSDLLQSQTAEITAERVRAALVRHECGLRVVLASESPRESALLGRTEQMEAVFGLLDGLARHLVLDLGAGLRSWAASILIKCDERIVVTDAQPHALQHTRILLDEIEALGVPAKDVRVVLNHRVRFDTQFPATEAEQALGHAIDATLRPAPELIMAASRRHLPGVLAMPEDPVAQQMLKIADGLLHEEDVSRWAPADPH